MNSDDGVPDEILGNHLSSCIIDPGRESPEFALLVSKVGLDPSPFLVGFIVTESFRDRIRQSLDELTLLEGCDMLTGLVLTAFKHDVKGFTCCEVERRNLSRRGQACRWYCISWWAS